MLFGDWLARGKQQPEHWYCQNTYHPKYDAIRFPRTEQYKTRKQSNERYHELCQQWRSAEAAVESARVAWMQFWIGWLGVTLVVGTFIATAFAAYFAYQAALATQKGAIADEASAKTADDTLKEMQVSAKRQLRAYVTLEDGIIIWSDQQVQLVIRFKCGGVTPAYRFKAWAILDVQPSGASPFSTTTSFGSEGIVGPGAFMSMNIQRSLDAAGFERIKDRTDSLFACGRAEYLDAFGEPRFFTFKTKVNGPLQTVRALGEKFTGWAIQPVPNGGFDGD
jgi:hypothetical protein